MRGVCLLVILALASCWPAYAESDYESERKALYENALLSGEDNSSALIGMLFDREFLIHNPCDMFREAFADNMIGADNPECDWEPEFSIEGISPEGQHTLIAAAETYDYFRLDSMNEQSRRY